MPVLSEPLASGPSSAASEAGRPEPLEPLPFPLEERHIQGRPRLCVVIPAFNEEAVLAQTGRALTAALNTLDAEWSVLFVIHLNEGGNVTKLRKVLGEL